MGETSFNNEQGKPNIAGNTIETRIPAQPLGEQEQQYIYQTSKDTKDPHKALQRLVELDNDGRDVESPEQSFEDARVNVVGLTSSPNELNAAILKFQDLKARESTLTKDERNYDLGGAEAEIRRELGIGTLTNVQELVALKAQFNLTGEQQAHASILSMKIEGAKKDYLYAIKYWKHNPSKTINGSYAIMAKEIVDAASQHGRLTAFATVNDPLSEKDKEFFSARRALARQIGFGVGEGKHDQNTGTISAPIKPLLTPKTTT